jgi:hypothetical protein
MAPPTPEDTVDRTPTGAGMTTHEATPETGRTFLDPIVRRVVFVILPAFAIAQWLLVIPLAREAGVWDSLEGHGIVAKKMTPFSSDLFFIVWNAFPILLWLLSLWIVSLLRTKLPLIHRMFGMDEPGEQFRRFERVRRHWGIWVPLTVIAAMACYFQIPKQETLIQTADTCFWWDSRISNWIFFIRLVALGTNMLLIGALLWNLVVVQVYLVALSRTGDPQPTLLHPDRSCGLRDFGAVSFRLTLPWILLALVGVAGLVTHDRKHGIANLIGDLSMLGGPFIVALGFFLYPAMNIRKKVAEKIRSVLRRLEPQVEEWNRKALRPGAASDPLDYPSELHAYRWLTSVTAWPFNMAIMVKLLAAVVAPLATFFVKSLLK